MNTKIEIQNANFTKLISLNLPPIQSRFIAYKLAELDINDFELDYKDSILKIITPKEIYEVEINFIDIPTNGIFKT
jgi:hypothetical protein